MRVVLDANVYISAILFGGNCEEILRLAVSGSFNIVILKDILTEIESILKEKFRWSKKQVAETISYIKDISTVIKPDVALSAVKKAAFVRIDVALYHNGCTRCQQSH